MKVKIGELAKMTGCQVVTIRYYEKEGLLKRPERTERNYRLYGEEDMARLRFIRHCRQHGMSLDEISRIEFVFKQKNYNGFPAIKSNVWPDDCTRQAGQNIILIPWTREETYKFLGGETLYMDTRITLRDSTDQPQTEILALKMSPTLFQEVDGA